MSDVSLEYVRTDIGLAPADGDSNAHFTIRETAVLSDGAVIETSAERGWTVFLGPMGVAKFLHGQQRSDIVREAQNSMLPDDAEVTGRVRDWSQLIDAFARAGIKTSVEQLDAASQQFVLSDELKAALQ